MVENLLRKDSTEKMKELREELAQKHLDDLQEIDDKHQLEMEVTELLLSAILMQNESPQNHCRIF